MGGVLLLIIGAVVVVLLLRKRKVSQKYDLSAPEEHTFRNPLYATSKCVMHYQNLMYW